MSNSSGSTPNPWYTPPQKQQEPKAPSPSGLTIPHVYTQVYRLLRDNAANWLAIYAGVIGAVVITILPFLYFAFRDIIDMALFPEAAYERMFNSGGVSLEGMMARLLFGYLVLSIAIAVIGSMGQALLLRGELREMSGDRMTFADIWVFDQVAKRGLIGHLAYLALITAITFIYAAASVVLALSFPPLFVIASLLFFVLLPLISLFLRFTPQFMADQGMSLMDAGRASIKTGQENLGSYLLLLLPLVGAAVLIELILGSLSNQINEAVIKAVLYVPLLAFSNFVVTYFYRHVANGQLTHRD